MADDYEKLGLGERTSLITKVTVSAWGSQVSLECLYDPVEKRLPYTLTFEDCQQIQWSVYDSDLLTDEEADLIGISLGKEDLREPAIIHTDIFELSILYSNFSVMQHPKYTNVSSSSVDIKPITSTPAPNQQKSTPLL